MTTYRAVVYVAPTGDETVMTGPDQSHLPDAELVEAAMREARDAGLMGEEWPQVPEDGFRARLQITEYTTC